MSEHTASANRRLVERFDALGRFTRLVTAHVPDPVQAGLAGDDLSQAQDLVERATARLRLCATDEGDHTVVALAGATGVGKSSLFNALARMELSPAGHLRPTTGHAHACVWNARGADALLDWLGVSPERRFLRESVLDAEDEAPLRGLVLLDLPDVDSVATGNRIESDRLVGIVDLVIWVLDPQKYADQTVHEEYLRHMGALRDVTVVVFNQTDRLTPADAQRCRADLARLVEADGLPGVPVISTSTVTGEGIEEVLVLLEKTVAGRPAAMARLEGELDATVDTFGPLVAVPAMDEEVVSREVVPELADGFATAVGVEAVAAESARAYRRRAAVPGWPFRRTADEPVEVAPADPSATGLSVRRLAARTSAGLPAPWPDEIRTAALADLEKLPDELAGAVARTISSRPAGGLGWRLARGLWWLGALAALVGLGLLVRTLVRGGSTPEAGPVPLSALLIGAGGLVVLVLPPLTAGLARLRARRHRRVAAGRLREATLTAAREVVAPVRVLLRDYAQARTALLGAGVAVPAAGVE